MKRSNTEEKLKTIIETLDNKKGINILAINVSAETSYTDYMVFVTSTSTQHGKTLSDSLLRELKTDGFQKPYIEGTDEGKWILVDAGDIIAHIMLDEFRHYYDLETIWASSPKVDIYSYIESKK